MSAPLDNPPYKSAVVDANEILTGDWTRWLQLFWARVVSAVQTTASVQPATVRTNQSATIGTTTVYTVTLSGLYRVSYRQRVTTAASINSSLTMTIGWREGGVTQSQSGAAMTGNTTSTQQNGTLFVRADSGTAITYALAYASTGTAMVFNYDVAVELVQ